MIALLVTGVALAGFEVGASAGLVLAEDSGGDGLESSGAATLYSGAGLLEFLRLEGHLGYTGVAGAEGVDAVNVKSRSGDLRLLGGVSFPFYTLPKVEFGGDVLVGADLRLTSTEIEILGIETSSVGVSVHPSVALGGYAEIWRARLGLRAWSDLPNDGRFGLSAMGGLRF